MPRHRLDSLNTSNGLLKKKVTRAGNLARQTRYGIHGKSVFYEIPSSHINHGWPPDSLHFVLNLTPQQLLLWRGEVEYLDDGVGKLDDNDEFILDQGTWELIGKEMKNDHSVIPMQPLGRPP